MKPLLDEQGKVIQRFIRRLGFKHIEKFEYCITNVKTSISDQAETIIHRLKEMSAKQTEVVIVECLEDLPVVLKQASDLKMADKSWKWVLPKAIQSGHMTSFLPESLLAIDVHRSNGVSTLPEEDIPEEDSLSYLEDTIVLIQKLVEKKAENDSVEGGENKMEEIKKNVKSLISRQKFQGRTGNIEFDSEGCRANVTYDIFEMVSMPTERRWLRVGSWSNGKVSTIFTQWPGNYSSISRPNFKVVTYFGEPWVKLVPVRLDATARCLTGQFCQNYTNQGAHQMTKPAGHEYCCSGYMIDFLLKLQKMLHFDARVHFVKDNKYGSLNRSAAPFRWSGLIGELVRGEADIALHLLIITADRLKVVDFSHPYMEVANGILVSSHPYSHSVWDFVFLTTFSGQLWLSMLLVVTMAVLVIWLAERLRLRRRYLRKPHKRHRSFSLSEIISYTWSLAFQKAAEELGPSSVAGRVLAGLFACCAIIACSSFTANLAAIKVTEKRGITLSGIYDSKFQNPNEHFKFSVLSDSASMDYFRGNSDPSLRRMAAFLEKYAVKSLSEASTKLKARKIQAFLCDIPLLKLLAYQENCDLKLSGKPFFFSGYGIAFSKNFVWRQQFSLAVLKLQDEGFFDELNARWIPQHCPNSEKPNGPSSLGLNEFGGIFLLLILGSIAGALLLSVEHCIWRSSSK